MIAPAPWYTRTLRERPSDASSVGVNVWNAMSISPRSTPSFIVDDFV